MKFGTFFFDANHLGLSKKDSKYNRGVQVAKNRSTSCFIKPQPHSAAKIRQSSLLPTRKWENKKPIPVQNGDFLRAPSELPSWVKCPPVN